MKDYTRLSNKLLQEEIHPTIMGGKSDAVELYTSSEKIKRELISWVHKIGVDEVRRVSLMRKPKSLSHCEEMIVNHVDNIVNIKKIRTIMECIDDGNMKNAWNLILS